MGKTKITSQRREITKVRLVSKKGEKVSTDEPPFYKCSRCHKIISQGYHYAQSNIGDIVLCQYCSDYCKRDLKKRATSDMDSIDKKEIDKTFHASFKDISSDTALEQVTELYTTLITTISQAYAPRKMSYMLDKFSEVLSLFVKYCHNNKGISDRAKTHIVSLIKDCESKYHKYRKNGYSRRDRNNQHMDLRARMNACNNLVELLKGTVDKIEPDEIIDRITILWESITFYTNSIKVTGRDSNQVLHCSLKGAKPFYNHFETVFTNLIPELYIELHSRKSPQVLNNDEFNEIFTYLEIQEEISNGNLEALKDMFKHVRTAKLSFNKILLPKDKSIYMNYLAHRHNNNYRYIPVYENDLKNCDAFLYTITKANECYIIWENKSTNTATYIFRCSNTLYTDTLHKVFDYISSEIEYKRLRLHRKDTSTNLGLEYRIVTHNTFTQWKTDIESYIGI